MRFSITPFLLIFATGLTSRAADRPNIVLILADDMGYSDVGCFGGEIETPNIDRLAREGVRMTQFYNGARCCPTRAALLTGLYAHQAGVGHMMEERGLPAYRGRLNDQCVTIAEALKPAGYRTAMAGKWHLSNAIVNKNRVNHQDNAPFWDAAMMRTWPRQRGFDSFYGIIIGVVDYFDPFSLTRDNQPIFDPPPADFYLTDAITDEAVRQINAIDDKPLFLYVAYTAPHWPLHALKDDIARYEDRYRAGWTELREARHARQVELGIVDPSWPIPPADPDVPAQFDGGERMAVYAAQIDRMDQGIGKILAALDQAKQADSTIVVFLSDNGACAEICKPNWFDVTTETRGGQPVGEGHGQLGSQRSYASYGPGWAWASNTPFRRYKHYVHEGGIATPFVIRFPGKTKAASIDRTPRHVIDLMPTFLQAAGASYPADKTPLAGMTLLENSPRDLFWEHEGNRAVRRGDWKLVAENERPWELYDMANDRTETNNVADANPELVRDLSSAYDRWAKRVGAVPYKELPKPIKPG